MDDQRYRFLALGDSYTIGEAVEPEERWPAQLVCLLREEEIEIDDPVIVAKTGWTTGELMAALDRENLSGTFDLVSLLIGVNNQYRGLSDVAYRQEFRDLLQRALRFAGGIPGHVVVLSIPDWGVTPFAEGRDREKIAREIDSFNKINLEESSDAGVHYIPVTEISRKAAKANDLIAFDGLHPSALMYEEWARNALPVVLSIFRGNNIKRDP